MSITIGPPTVDELKPRIAVIGVGGAGGNAVGNMIQSHVQGVDFIVANTDAQALNASVAEMRIQLGPDITQGLGAGSRPEVGRAAAEETIAEMERALDGAHMCFIAAGMGGGTGTGAAPVIAEAARRLGVLTVGVVTKPFLFEGTRRMRSAEAGIAELQKHVDTLIVIPNQNLFLVAKSETTFKEAFQLADEVLQQGVRSITDLMAMPGLINLDFADVRSVMGEMGKAMMGTGEGEGENLALIAAEKAIANPLLDGVSMQGAKGVIISIIGGEDMKLLEIDEAANHIRELVDPDANIIWGSAFNPELDGKIRVSVVATGIEATAENAASPQPMRAFSMAQNRPAAAAAPVSSVASSAAAAAERTRAEQPPVVAPISNDVDDVEAPAAEPIVLHAPDEDDALDLVDQADAGDDGNAGDQVDQGPFAPPVGAAAASSASDDELLLDAGRISAPVTDDDQIEPAENSPLMGRNKPVEKPAPRIASGGGTLFERMANLSRGQSRDSDDDGDDDGPALNIPRFLGRQNNQ